ncbi:hypothetical protein B0H19DRAFT_1381617 [Mycena capillaripes]|nr:hypothetical protein B0H19DRAFT_1381617 [Mycena capillaripes]
MASHTPLLREGKYPNDEDEQLSLSESMSVCDCAGVKHSNHSGSRSEKWLVKLAICACLASLLCTFFNISFLTVRSALLTPSNEIKFSNLSLPFGNVYYGLENALRVSGPNATPAPEPIQNPPFFASYVNASAPGTPPFQHPSQWTDFGTVYRTDRRFRVASGISTVFQFRVRDFGMERCNLTLLPFVPPPPRSGTHGHRAVDETKATGTFKGRVELYRLRLDNERLNPETLSWDTRPARVGDALASWDVSNKGRVDTSEFACPSGSIMTFELACAGASDCQVDFNQPREHFTSALFLMQSSSM